MITPEELGSALFRQRYGVRYAYIAGSMYKGISSKALVVRMGQAGFLGFFGTGGLSLPDIADAIDFIQAQLKPDKAYGMNLLCNLEKPAIEMEQIEMFLAKGIKNIEAAAFMQITPALVRYRLKGLTRNPDGSVHIPNRVMAKVSRPETAKAFMSPAPEPLIRLLLAAGHLTKIEAQLGDRIPMAHEICVEADSGGHTDQGVAFVLLPTIKRLCQEMMATYHYAEPLLIGAAGGLGTPEAIVAAFLLGADFVLTGSINQCTVEAGTSDAAKELLAHAEIQDMAYAPAGDMFELGAKVQVLKRGLFFSIRANKLYQLYQQHSSLEEIEDNIQKQIQEKYFKRSFAQVWEETRNYYLKTRPELIFKAEEDPKYKMTLIFKWYFIHSTRLAMQGSTEQLLDYQIQCGPALGAFNAWVKGTPLEAWQHRRVDKIAEKLMIDAADYLTNYIDSGGIKNSV